MAPPPISWPVTDRVGMRVGSLPKSTGTPLVFEELRSRQLQLHVSAEMAI